MTPIQACRLVVQVARSPGSAVTEATGCLSTVGNGGGGHGKDDPRPSSAKENPLSTERVSERGTTLMTPVLGAERAEEVIRRANALESWEMCANRGRSWQPN